MRRPGKAVVPPPGSSGAVSATCRVEIHCSAGPKVAPRARTPTDGSEPAASFVAATVSLLRPGAPPDISRIVPPDAATSARAMACAGPSCSGSTNSETGGGSSFRRASGTRASVSAGSI